MQYSFLCLTEVVTEVGGWAEESRKLSKKYYVSFELISISHTVLSLGFYET